MAADCVFCGIIKKEIPSYTVYEDDLCIAFLPLGAINPGHVLLAPKAHHDDYFSLPESLAAHLAARAQAIGRRIQRKIRPVRVGLAVVGFDVAHVHLHIVPLNKKHEITSSAYAVARDGEIAWTEENLFRLTDGEKREIQALLASD